MAHTKLEWFLVTLLAIGFTFFALALIGSGWQELINRSLAVIR